MAEERISSLFLSFLLIKTELKNCATAQHVKWTKTDRITLEFMISKHNPLVLEYLS